LGTVDINSIKGTGCTMIPVGSSGLIGGDSLSGSVALITGFVLVSDGAASALSIITVSAFLKPLARSSAAR
jgi:hypothetical protein